MKNILVAVDDPRDAEQLTKHAVNIAELTNARIWIIHVSQGNPHDFLARETGPQFVYDKRAEENKKEAASIKKWARGIVEKYNVDAEGLLIEGPVTESIRKIVDEKNIDLVVAGHKRKNLLYSLFTSNKKKDLVDDLKIPLLAVPLE
ncbi:universal stress protein [Antarcticibacterium flavum]|uniref:Universal stress protein n=1 Tax=Antarcticibacterium flavum TaxID=2058175 RepID=A0A5B7X4E2_9FLAO|nr:MULTISPECIES: universal stress protein [Antarcticibacterium]MCM4158519.1 universal stress protein [Antarcticibacterium sp. W02-3]QCY70267.1 universal stress protein [Antarcticibacterium flavum]